MKIFKKYLDNKMFWIGFQSAWLLTIIADFANGRTTWLHALSWGIVTILCIAWDRMLLEKEENE